MRPGTVRIVLPIVRVDGRAFAMLDADVDTRTSHEVEAIEVTGLVSYDATDALVDDNASARRSWLGGQWTEDGGVTEAPGDGVELRSVTLAVEVRYSVASEGGDGGGE